MQDDSNFLVPWSSCHFFLTHTDPQESWTLHVVRAEQLHAVLGPATHSCHLPYR